MKILLIHSERGNNDVAWFKGFLEEMDVHVDVLSISDRVDLRTVRAFVDFFNSPVSMARDSCQILTTKDEITSHVLIVSALSGPWVDFFLGFSCGSPAPLIFYGENTLAGVGGEYRSCFTVFEAEDSIKEYFMAENEVVKKHEAFMAAGKAKEALLRLGIPITEEAFANSVAKGLLTEAGLFLDAGFTPDTVNVAGIPMLNIAARHGQRTMLQFLVRSGAGLNALAEDRHSTALIDSALGKHIDLVKDLIKAGADLNIQTKDGQTALIVAVGSSCEEIFEALLKAGADPDLTDKLGMSARKYASFFSKPGITSLFEKYAPL